MLCRRERQILRPIPKHEMSFLYLQTRGYPQSADVPAVQAAPTNVQALLLRQRADTHSVNDTKPAPARQAAKAVLHDGYIIPPIFPLVLALNIVGREVPRQPSDRMCPRRGKKNHASLYFQVHLSTPTT